MYETIEAIYDNGRIYPTKDKIKIGKARVLLTILENGQEKRVTSSDIVRFSGSISLGEEPLYFQQRMRDEWG